MYSVLICSNDRASTTASENVKYKEMELATTDNQKAFSHKIEDYITLLTTLQTTQNKHHKSPTFASATLSSPGTSYK